MAAEIRRQKHILNERTERNSRKKNLSKMKTSNLLDVELKTWVIRMLSELQERDSKHKTGHGKH